MDEQLKELLGESYKEGMSKEEIQEAFKKSFLATGQYVNKDMAEADKRKLNDQIKNLNSQVKSKMTDDEIKKAEFEELKKQLEIFKQNDINNKINNSKLVSTTNLAEAKTLLEIKDTDKEFIEFIANISGEDTEVSKKVSTYAMSLIKKAYEKGKAESTKTELGQMGNMVIGADGKLVDKDAQFVKNLIATAPISNIDYSKRPSNFI